VVWVVEGIARGRHTHANRRRKDPVKDVPRAARVKIRGHHQDASPATFGHQLAQGFRLLARVPGGVREANHSVGRNTALNQVALHQFSQAGIPPQLATAGDDARSPAATVELRSARGAVGGVVVVPEQEDSIGEL